MAARAACCTVITLCFIALAVLTACGGGADASGAKLSGVAPDVETLAPEPEGGFAQPPGTIPVSFVVDDRLNRVYGKGELKIKGSFLYSRADRTIVLDPIWSGGPPPLQGFPTLWDDGPWTEGGHEPVGERANDHRWGVTVFVQPPAEGALYFEYGLIDFYYERTYGNGWLGPGGFFVVPAGATAPIDTAVMRLDKFGKQELGLLLDVTQLTQLEGWVWDLSFVGVKSSWWGWHTLPMTYQGDGIYSLQLGEWIDSGYLPHTGFMGQGDTADVVFVLGGASYTGGGRSLTGGVTAMTRCKNAETWEPQPIGFAGPNGNILVVAPADCAALESFPPTGLTATAADGQVTLTWDAAQDGTQYNLYWSTSPGVSLETANRVAGVSSPYVHSGLTNWVEYHYVLTAVAHDRESAPSREVRARPPVPTLSITLGEGVQGTGLTLDEGSRWDTMVVTAGLPPQLARATGNGVALPSPDGNTVPDGYLQLKVDDAILFDGAPTRHVRVEVDYLDQGTDRFTLRYDGLPWDGLDGTFSHGGSVVKTNTGLFKTAVFSLCDAAFANRDDGADLQISDNGDGAEVIRAVRVLAMPNESRTINVDDYGASPFDYELASVPIQAALDDACSGDTVTFTSCPPDVSCPGYWIDRTLFLTGKGPKHGMTFTATDPTRHAQLRATPDLKGFVVQLYARSLVPLRPERGRTDDIDFGFIDVDGGRNWRTCAGPDGIRDGADDSFGSWLPECASGPSEAWCAPGNISFRGGSDLSSAAQDYLARPDLWSTGLYVHDVVSTNASCGGSLWLTGAAGTVSAVTIRTVGGHGHTQACVMPDSSGGVHEAGSGISYAGPGHVITANTIINASLVGIAGAGGRDARIEGNTVRIGRINGAFAGIALDAGSYGDQGGTRVVGNTIVNQGDPACGGLHIGISLGGHTAAGGCGARGTPGPVGTAGCVLEPTPPAGALCPAGNCQKWLHIPAESSLTFRDNVVTGAHASFVLEGLDMLGTFDEGGNLSQGPRWSDWDFASPACLGTSIPPVHRVAHHPSMTGWLDVVLHCR